MGIIEFGRAYNTLISLQGAAREGARSLALGNATATVEASVRSATLAQVDLINQTPCPAAGGTATVQVAQNFDFNIPFVPLNVLTIQATASMRCGL
jgi:Flp pilus assembly protein TadG